MLRIVCILSLLGLALGDTVVLNQVVDQLLSGLNAELLKNGKDTIPIENMNHDWRYKFHHIASLSGHCNCHDGYARSLATLRRTGDVVMSTSGNTATLSLALGLGTLEFGFRACQFKAKHLFSVTQHVKASVSSNSIAAQITLVKNGDQCFATVNNIGLNNLGKISIHTGGGVLHKIEDKILDWFTKHFHGKVVSAVNNKLQDGARSRIGQMDLCKKIPF